MIRYLHAMLTQTFLEMVLSKIIACSFNSCHIKNQKLCKFKVALYNSLKTVGHGFTFAASNGFDLYQFDSRFS